MARAEIWDLSPYSHLGTTNKKNISGIVAVSDGAEIHSYKKVDELIPEVELLGLYHYLRSSVPLKDQIDAFDEAINPWIWDFLAVDFEKIHNTHLGGGFAKMAKDFIDEFIEAYGKPVLLYSSPSVIQEWMIPYGQVWYKDYDLWIAQYPYNEAVYGPQSRLLTVPTDPVTWNPRLPAGATNWKIWQYSAGGNERASEFGAYGNPDLDLNVFNGTIEEMKEWCKVESVPEPPTPPVPPTPVDCSKVREQTISECIVALEEL